MILERKIMRKIFVPTRLDDGHWRIKLIKKRRIF